jgi:hypothetical protein
MAPAPILMLDTIVMENVSRMQTTMVSAILWTRVSVNSIRVASAMVRVQSMHVDVKTSLRKIATAMATNWMP